MSKPKREKFGWLNSEVDLGYVERYWRGWTVAFLLLAIGSLFVASFWPALFGEPISKRDSLQGVIAKLSCAFGLILITFSNWNKGRVVIFSKVIIWGLLVLVATLPSYDRAWVFMHFMTFLAASLLLFVNWYEGLKEPAPEFFAKTAKSEPSRELK